MFSGKFIGKSTLGTNASKRKFTTLAKRIISIGFCLVKSFALVFGCCVRTRQKEIDLIVFKLSLCKAAQNIGFDIKVVAKGVPFPHNTVWILQIKLNLVKRIYVQVTRVTAQHIYDLCKIMRL